MKNILNRFLILFLFVGFLYVQVPFAVFHHHESKSLCELNDHSNAQSPFDNSKKHFHEHLNDACFLCSAHLLKEYQVKDHILSFSTTFIITPYVQTDPQLSSSFFSSSSARAPPALA